MIRRPPRNRCSGRRSWHSGRFAPCPRRSWSNLTRRVRADLLQYDEIMRSAIESDADPQQMIPKPTCLLLKTGQAEFSELVLLRATSPNEALQSFSVAKR